MTQSSSFKRRVRARMAKTGERYGAARRALLTGGDRPAPTGGDRVWASPPEVDDGSVRAATGRVWNEWCDLIEAWPGHADGHTAIANHLAATYGLNGWWSQGVTVGWERITGRRQVNQRTDGTFSAGITRTVTVDLAALRAMIVDDADRLDLFPGMATTLRSRPTSKSLRVGISGQGSILLSFADKANGRVALNISHDELTSADDVAFWKAHWRTWLEALDDDGPDGR